MVVNPFIITSLSLVLSSTFFFFFLTYHGQLNVTINVLMLAVETELIW